MEGDDVSCDTGRHLECTGFMPGLTACVCACHLTWASACRWGLHKAMPGSMYCLMHLRAALARVALGRVKR